jgi:hypothetical protein
MAEVAAVARSKTVGNCRLPKLLNLAIITYLSLPKIGSYFIPPSGGMVRRKRPQPSNPG